jgi:hypothetical protein
MPRVRTILVLASVAALAASLPAAGKERWEEPVVEYVSIDPKVEVGEIGDGPRRPEGPLNVAAHLRNPGAEEARVRVVLGARSEAATLAPGAAASVAFRFAPDESPYGRVLELRRGEEVLDRAEVFDERTHRVAVLVERRTWRAGVERFGSFTRRLRESFGRLHRLLDGAGGGRRPVADRFRIDRVEVYDRKEGERPALFDDHPSFDLVVACDEGGPLAGFWLPAYSIGHNFRYEKHGNVKGLWSDWGEQALWHEVVHYRGVPDYYISRIPAGNLAGVTADAVDLPEPYRGDLMASAYRTPRLGDLAALVMISKRGVSRVGACEEPEEPYGHMWRWLPERLVLEVARDGEPMRGARVRWWASEPGGGPDFRVQKVDPARKPDGEADADEGGRIEIRGDYLNRGRKRIERSLWLLVTVESEGGERRFAIVYGLELNEAYAKGDREEQVRRLAFEDLRPAATAR